MTVLLMVAACGDVQTAESSNTTSEVKSTVAPVTNSAGATTTAPSPTGSVEPTPAWESLAPMSVPRSEFQAVALDGLIYAAGGIRAIGSGPAEAYDTLEVYDPGLEDWSTLASMPEPRHHLITAAYDHRLFVFGGLAPASWVATDTAWRYDPESDRWTELAPIPEDMASGVAVTIGDTIFVVPGVGADQTLWAYDPLEDSWTELTAPSRPRDHLSGATLDGRLYVSGGRWSLAGESDTVEVYHPATGEWSTVASMNDRRSGHAMAATVDAIYAFGGELLSNSTTLRSVEVYDPVQDEWMRLDDLGGPVHGVSAVVVDGSIYLVGGASTVGQADATGNMLRLTP